MGKFWLIALVGVLSSGTVGALSLAVPQDVLDDYRKLTDGKDVLAITDYRGAGSRRDTVELVLFQQALNLGAMTAPLDFRVVDSYSRILLEVAAGRIDASPTTVWAADVADSQALKSAPLIDEGEYRVGFYALEGNDRVLHADLALLRTLTAVTNRAWTTDLRVLQSLGIDKIESAPTFVQIAAMVVAGRGDFFMRSFKPGPDMAAEYEGKRFLPVRGIQIAFPGSRHFLVAPGAEGRKVVEALNRGLKELSRRGLIQRAYTDAGFFTPQISHWTLVNPPQ